MNAVMPLKNNENNPILDNLTTGVLVVNREYKVIFMNPAAEELLGTSSRMAGQIKLNEILVDGGPATFLDCLKTEQPSAHSYTYREISLHPPNAPEHMINCTITQFDGGKLLIEISSVDRI